MGETEVAEFFYQSRGETKCRCQYAKPGIECVGSHVYKHVVGKTLDDFQAVCAKKPKRLPGILTQKEVRRLLQNLDGGHWFPACLLYGSGLRLMECLRLRVQDLNFDQRVIVVRTGKGLKDRAVTLPEALVSTLQRQLEAVRNLQ